MNEPFILNVVVAEQSLRGHPALNRILESGVTGWVTVCSPLHARMRCPVMRSPASCPTCPRILRQRNCAWRVAWRGCADPVVHCAWQGVWIHALQPWCGCRGRRIRRTLRRHQHTPMSLPQSELSRHLPADSPPPGIRRNLEVGWVPVVVATPKPRSSAMIAGARL